MKPKNIIFLLVYTLVVWFVPNSHAQTYSILKSFGSPLGAPGGQPHGKMVQAADGTLYGLNTSSVDTGGNQAHDGTIFKIRPDGSGFTILKSFTNFLAEGSGPYGGLWLDGETLYGTRSTGGASGSQGSPTSGKGVLFKINTDGSGFTVLRHFSGADGENPRGRPLVVGEVVYGTTYYGGTNGVGPGTPAGTVYRVNTHGSDFAVLKHFGAADGAGAGEGPQAGLIFSGGNLYGTTTGGGGSPANGNVFTLGTNGLGFQVLRTFSYGNSFGATPEAGLTFAGGKVYGVTSTSSVGSGKVFRLNPDGTDFDVIASVPNSVGAPKSELEIQGDTIFGTAIYSSAFTTGSVFRVFTDGTGFEVLKTFSQGSHPGFIGVNVWGNTLFGVTTLREGQNLASYGGQVFSMSVTGSSFTKLKDLGGTDGDTPYSGLTQVGDWFYGTTYQGGSSQNGVAFKIKSDGSGYGVLKNFAYNEVGYGSWPHGELETDASDPNDASFNLYGVTQYGGLVGGNGGGIIYRMNNNGGSFQVLTNLDAYAVTNSTGSMPMAGLLRSGDILYGTTRDSGPLGRGTVFKLNTDGTGFTVLTDFPGNGGRQPLGRLVLVGGTLYGTTEFGGDFDHGTVFKVNTEGSGFAVLKSFTSSEIGQPRAGLLVYDNALIGTANTIVFKMNLDGSGFTVLKDFSGTGISWLSGLTSSGGSLYGASRHGGSSGFSGVVYKLNPDGSGFEIINTFTTSTGWRPESPVIVSGGEIYGTTTMGGPGGRGVVYRIKYSEETPIAASQDATAGDLFLNNFTDLRVGNGVRSAIQFSLPPGLDPAKIQNATMRLYLGTAHGNSSGFVGLAKVRAHQLLEPWSESSSFFNSQYSSNYVEASIFLNSPSSSLAVGKWMTWDVTELVRGWAINPASNFGVVLMPNFSGIGFVYEVRFNSSEHANTTTRPVLELTYPNPTQHVGSVTIQITPPESITAGAQWRMDGGSWLNSGVIVSNVPAGNHQVEFKRVLEWATPDPMTVRVIGNKVTSNSVAYLADPLLGYNVGQIPTQYVYGVETKVLKVLNPLGGSVDLYAYNPYPGSGWNWSAATGIAQYTPSTTNFPPFSVTFGYYNGPTLIQQAVYFMPSSNEPPGAVDISFSGPLSPPGDEASKYQQVTVVTNAPKSFNNQLRATRSIEIAGKTVVFEQGHTNGLYDAFNEQNDLETFGIHAETLIVRSPLRLPQTDVTIYARELQFEGDEAHIETTPRSLTTRPANFVAGQSGLDAGDITVLIESLTNQPAGSVRFVLKGGDGQPGGLGLEGAPGLSYPHAPASINGDYGNISIPRHDRTVLAVVHEEVVWLDILPTSIFDETYVVIHDHSRKLAAGEGFSFCSGSPPGCTTYFPTSGQQAVAGGKPGNGGGGGKITSQIRLTDLAMNIGGRSAIATQNRGGVPGTPQPALKWENNREVQTFDPGGEIILNISDSWHSIGSYITSPGSNATSSSTDFEVGPAGGQSAIGHTLSWLSPKALSMVLTNAEDAYYHGYLAEAEEVLADYDDLLTRYQTYSEWLQLTSQWQTEFTNLLAAIQALRQRIAVNTVNLGSNITFNATSPGTEPLSYQWLFNGVAIAGATNASLTLSNIGSVRQGSYQVVITNNYGSVTSSVAALNVQLPPGYFKLNPELLSGGMVRLSFIGEPGQSYALDRSASLFPIAWVPQITNAAASNGNLIFTNAPDPLSFNFWRVRAVP